MLYHRPSTPTYHFHTALLYIQVRIRISQSRDDIELCSRMDILVHNLDRTIPLGNLEKDMIYDQRGLELSTHFLESIPQ
jgi:hypothetical protein